MAAKVQIGRMSSLSDAIVGVAISSERLKVIQQPHHATFVLYDVREDLAEEFKCVNRLDSSRVSPKALKSRSFGKYVGAMFTITPIADSRQNGSDAVATRRRLLEIDLLDVDPEIDQSRVPNLGAAVPADAPLEYVQGDRDMVKAASSS